MIADCHMHTPLCGHAIGDPELYVDAASEAGIELITFTCHIPMPGYDFGGPNIRMDASQIPDYLELIRGAARYGEGKGVEVLCGIEAEIFPEQDALKEMDELLAAHDFDFVLGSLHSHLPAYQQWLAERDITEDRAIIDTYFKHLIEGARSGRYHSLSHLDVVRLYGVVSRYAPAEHEDIIHELAKTVLECGLCLEVNTSGLTKGDYQVHPDPLILEWVGKLGVRFTLGSDAHKPSSVGQFFPDACNLLRQHGVEHYYYHRSGKACEIPLS